MPLYSRRQIILSTIDPPSKTETGEGAPISCQAAHTDPNKFAAGWPTTEKESRIWPGFEQAHYDYSNRFNGRLGRKIRVEDESSSQLKQAKLLEKHSASTTTEPVEDRDRHSLSDM